MNSTASVSLVGQTHVALRGFSADGFKLATHNHTLTEPRKGVTREAIGTTAALKPLTLAWNSSIVPSPLPLKAV